MIPPPFHTLRAGDRIHGYNAGHDAWHVVVAVEGLTHVFVPLGDTFEVGDTGWETAWSDQRSDLFPQAAVWVHGRDDHNETAMIWTMWEKTYLTYAAHGFERDLLRPFVIGADHGR